MKLVQSASIPIGNEEVKVVPVTGQAGLYSVENAYAGRYNFFRKALTEGRTSEKESTSLIQNFPTKG